MEHHDCLMISIFILCGVFIIICGVYVIIWGGFGCICGGFFIICGARFIICGSIFIMHSAFLFICGAYFTIFADFVVMCGAYCTICCLIHYTRCFILAVIFHIICGASFRYTHGASLSFDLKRGQQHKEAWDCHFEGLSKIRNRESGILDLKS